MRGRPPNNVIPEEDIPMVAPMYKDGLSIRQLSQVFNVSTYAIRAVLIDQGVKFRGRGRPEGYSPKQLDLFEKEEETPLQPTHKPIDHPILATKENADGTQRGEE